jgi:hypothetical protein
VPFHSLPQAAAAVDTRHGHTAHAALCSANRAQWQLFLKRIDKVIKKMTQIFRNEGVSPSDFPMKKMFANSTLFG